MSTSDLNKPITVRKLPLILKKRIIVKCRIKEDIIYESKPGDFMSGEVQSMTIIHQSNALTQTSKTIAKCRSHSGDTYEKTSEEIIKLIGQTNYDILFSSLCSIISQELKIRSINSLLTVPKKKHEVGSQTGNYLKYVYKNALQDISCQTNETSIRELKKFKPVRRNKRQQAAPYVVKDCPELKKPKKLVISPDNFNMILTKSKSNSGQSTSLPVLEQCFDEDSNSTAKMSILSVTTTPDLLFNPLNILKNVDKHTRDLTEITNKPDVTYTLHNLDTNETCPSGTSPMHNIQHVPPGQRRIGLLQQAINDWKYSLTLDEDGHL